MEEYLSYSSWAQMSNCEMAYVHRKILNTPVDQEDEDRTAFDVGSATHKCMEQTNWGEVELTQSMVDTAVEEFKDAIPHKGLVHAMALVLIEQQRASGFSCVKSEQKISTDKFLGFIDQIAVDSLGGWYIVDLKTASSQPNDGLIARLPMDRQLNLYASYAELIAPHFDLVPRDFRGCVYRVIVKSKAVQKESEGYESFVKRVTKLTKAYDVIIPVELMNPAAVRGEFDEAYERSIELRSGVSPKKNFGACFNYFKLCPYFSQCHGDKAEDIVKKLKVVSSSDYKELEKRIDNL